MKHFSQLNKVMLQPLRQEWYLQRLRKWE